MGILDKYFKVKGTLVVNSKTKQMAYVINKKKLPKIFLKKLPKSIKIRI